MAKPANTPADAQPHGPLRFGLGRIHDRVLNVLAEINAGAPADRAIKNAFRRARDLGSRDRANIREIIYGVLKHQRKIDDTLERALKTDKKKWAVLDKPIQERIRLLTYFALQNYQAEDLIKTDSYAYKRLGKLFDRILSGKLSPAKYGETTQLGVELSLPDWMVESLVSSFGVEQTRVYGQALLTRAPICLRIEPKWGREQALKDLQERGIEAQASELSPHGVILPQFVDLSSWDEFKEGLVEVQDEGSQLIALATGAQPGDDILDACAGAGGKTLALCSLLEGQGRLVAMDPEKKKLDQLKKRSRRAGIKKLEIKNTDLESMPEEYHNSFDCVLVDAPCSATGTLRRSPDLRWKLTPEEVERQVTRQKRLLVAATAAIKPGGRLIYATCSVLEEENERVVLNALEEDLRLEALPLNSLWGNEVSQKLGATSCARIGPGPSQYGPDGFFIGAFRRKSE